MTTPTGIALDLSDDERTELAATIDRVLETLPADVDDPLDVGLRHRFAIAAEVVVN